MADTWTMLSGYTASNYVDTMVFEVVSATKKIKPLSGQTLVAGEKNSQYVRFEMDRFWDGIDISAKNFSITYSLAGKYYGTSEAVSAEVSTDKLRFGWIVPEEACCIAGTLMFVLVIKSDGYVLKTQIAETPVVKSLDEESVVPEPTREAWYIEFQARVQADLDASQAALTSAQDALTRANTANDAASSVLTAASEANLAAQDAITVAKIRYGSPLVANAGPEMVETNRVYVFTGSESAYAYGHWYYYDNGVWNDGGVYNGNSVNTDKTLSIENMPADAKKTGDEISELKEDLKSCGIQSKVIRNAYPDSSGVITAGSWDTYCYRVASGQKINSIELASASQQLVFAYYADEPAIDSVSYNNSRIPMGSGVVTAKNIFVPKSDSINWIAIRCATSDKPVVEFENVGDVNNAIIFRDTTGIADINSIRDTSVRYISSGNASNLPANGAWYLMSMRHDSNNHLQLAYKAQGTDSYIRAMAAGTWGDWQSIGSELIPALESKSFTRNSASGITDANAITDIGYSYLSANGVSNLPDSGAWYVWTVSLDGSNLMQLAYNARGTNSYIRAKVRGTWGAWERIGKESVDELAVTSSIAMFPSVGCCGDSFTAGYLYNKTDSQWYDPNYVPNGEYPAIGYPAVMGRLYGVDVTAFAKGGLTTTAYRTDTKGLPAILNDTAKDLYIIALGLNDKTQNVPLGVEADIDTEPASATYLGNMGAIIRAIQTHAPYSRIILCKSLWMNNDYYSYISNGVELLSSHLGIPYIETLGDPYFESSAYKYGLKGLHPTAPLYAGMGKRIGELVGKCVIDNPTYFYNFYVPNT